MKATGIVRLVGGLGRIVIPKEIRRTLHIDDGTPLELFVEGDKIIYRKYQPTHGQAMNCMRHSLRYAMKPGKTRWII